MKSQIVRNFNLYKRKNNGNVNFIVHRQFGHRTVDGETLGIIWF